MSSCIRKEMGEHYFSSLEKYFPQIEKNLFEELDPIVVGYLLNGSEIECTKDWAIRFYPVKKVEIRIDFEHSQKRIGISIWDYSHKHDKNNILEHLRKTCGIMVPKNKHVGHHYDFKYSPQNCRRIVNIVTEMLIYFDKAS